MKKFKFLRLTQDKMTGRKGKLSLFKVWVSDARKALLQPKDAGMVICFRVQLKDLKT